MKTMTFADMVPAYQAAQAAMAAVDAVWNAHYEANGGNEGFRQREALGQERPLLMPQEVANALNALKSQASETIGAIAAAYPDPAFENDPFWKS